MRIERSFDRAFALKYHYRFFDKWIIKKKFIFFDHKYWSWLVIKIFLIKLDNFFWNKKYHFLFLILPAERIHKLIISMFSTKTALSKTSLLHSSKYFASKQLLFGTEARKKLLEGCKQLAEAVQVTLGPGGRNVLIDQTYGSPKITKDGVTVAKAIELEDKSLNIGASLVKSVANKANDEAGDGTTTATILARAIFEEGFKKVESGINPTHIKKGIDQAVDFIIE